MISGGRYPGFTAAFLRGPPAQGWRLDGGPAPREGTPKVAAGTCTLHEMDARLVAFAAAVVAIVAFVYLYLRRRRETTARASSFVPDCSMTPEESHQLAVEVVLPTIEGRNMEEEARHGRLHLPEDGFPQLEVPRPFFDVLVGVSAGEVADGFPSPETTRRLMDVRPTLHCASTDPVRRYTLCNVLLRRSPTLVLGSEGMRVGPSHYWADTIIEGAFWTENDLLEINSMRFSVPTTNGMMNVDTPWSPTVTGYADAPIKLPEQGELDRMLPQYGEIPVEFIANDVRADALVRFVVNSTVRRSADRLEVRTGLGFEVAPPRGSFFQLPQIKRLVILLHGFLRFCSGRQTNPIDFSVYVGSQNHSRRKVLGPFWEQRGPPWERPEATAVPHPPVSGWWKRKSLEDLLARWFELSTKHPDVAAVFRSPRLLPDPSSSEPVDDIFRRRILLIETMRPRNRSSICPAEIYEEHVASARQEILKDPRIDLQGRHRLVQNLDRANMTEVSLRRHLRQTIEANPEVLRPIPTKFWEDASELRHAFSHESGMSAAQMQKTVDLNPFVLLCVYVRVLEEMGFRPEEVQRLMGNPGEGHPYWIKSGIYSEPSERTKAT